MGKKIIKISAKTLYIYEFNYPSNLYVTLPVLYIYFPKLINIIEKLIGNLWSMLYLL